MDVNFGPMKIIIESLQRLFNKENDFFTLAKSGKRLTHIALAIPLVIIFLLGGMIISQIVFQIIFQKIILNVSLQKELIAFYGLFVSFGFVILVVWMWVRFFEKRSLSTLGFTKNRAFKKYLTGFLSGVFMLTVVITLMALFGTIGFKENPKPIDLKLIGVFGLMLLGYIVQGASEEILATLVQRLQLI